MVWSRRGCWPRRCSQADRVKLSLWSLCVALVLTGRAATPAGSIRFQGVIPLKAGGKLLDRTTLTPLPDSRVRQVIEQSRDGGVTWQTGYDAYYVRKHS
jgi:hypothetical protein